MENSPKSTKRTHSIPLRVRLLREGVEESSHVVHAVVCDSRSHILSVAGDGSHTSFVRSSLKPFQALTFVNSGVLEQFDLNDLDLAIACSSHAGTVKHGRQAFRILWQTNLQASDLQCPIPEGKQSPLEHNCSGKHAAMLAVCRQQSWQTSSYMDRKHPLQRSILGNVAELLKMPVDEILGAKDDCGVPTYMLQLNQMAALYGHLTASDRLDLERIVRAMVAHPELIAGDGYFDTELMRLSDGEIVSKTGAEGIQCVGRVGEGMGLAVKVVDGSKRAKYAATLHILQQLGWITPTAYETLSSKFLQLSLIVRLDVVGDLQVL